MKFLPIQLLQLWTRRSSHEERGLKSATLLPSSQRLCRSSHEERGLKSDTLQKSEVLVCRSSHEERGLKLRI